MSIYKGNNLIAGGSADTYFVKKPAWSQAIELSPVDLTAGYKAPADGMIIGSFYYSKTDRHYFFTLNGANIMPLLAGDTLRPLTLNLTVNKGDIIDCTVPSAADLVLIPSIKFVPFEDSTVSESDVEVVTPELIRNLHDPDWSHAVAIRTPQLVEGYTVPKRGIAVGSFIPDKNSVTETPIVKIKINDIVVSYTRTASNEITPGSVQCPVCAYDVIKLEGIAAENCDAHFSFVPYKAQ